MVRGNASREVSRLLAVVVTVAVIAALYLAKVVLLPLALAMLFAFLLAPLVGLLERIHLPRVLAILLVILAFGVAVGSVGWTVARQLVDVTSNLPDYRANIAEKLKAFHRTRNTSFSRAQDEVQRLGQQIGVSPSAETGTARRGRTREALGTPQHPLSVRDVDTSGSPFDALPRVLEPLASLLLVTVFTFFMLLQREDLRNRLIRLTGRGHLNVMTQAMDEASNRVSRYFLLQLLVNACYGAIIFTAMHFLGLPHAMLWGALATLLRFVPYIGAPIAALLPTLFSMAVFNGWEQTLIVMAVFFCMEVFTANFLEPHLYGKHTGLSSLAILVAAVFWTLIWGPVGLVLSVPLTVCLVVVGAHVPNLAFLKVLLGDQPVMRPEAHYYQRLLASDQREAAEVLEIYLKENSLQELYDAVLIPALGLSEQDRHRNALDDATVTFINQTTKELVEELTVRNGNGSESLPAATAIKTGSVAGSAASGDRAEASSAVSPLKIVCVPVRDSADEIVSLMLCQLLERAGHHVQTLPLDSVDTMRAAAAAANPDLVYLSGLPPYALAYARSVYKKLRIQQPQLKIVICLWNYTGDPVKAAREVSGGKQDQLCTTMAQAVSQAASPAPPISDPNLAAADVALAEA